MALTEITAEFKRIGIAFGGENPGDQRTVIASAAPTNGTVFAPEQLQGGLFTLKGRDDEHDLIPGTEYKFYGNWSEYRGRQQFWFKQFIKVEPHTRLGIVQYLRRHAPGIGSQIAQRIYDQYGTNSCKVLRSQPYEVATAIKGLTRKVAKDAANALQAIQELEDTRIDLTNLFAKRGFPHSLVNKCINRWGILAAKRVQRDPFSLLVEGFPGCGFARCDRLYNDLGLPMNRVKRQMLCIWNEIKSNFSGHTWFRSSDVASKLQGLVSGANPLKALKLGVRAGWLQVRKDSDGKTWVAIDKAATNERVIFNSICELITNETPIEWPYSNNLESLTLHQQEEYFKATRNRFGILAGTPGTGKTYTAASIIKAIAEVHTEDSIAVVAPTGKASVRCTATMKDHGLDIEATTIHRLLGVSRNGHDGGGWGFIHDETNPLLFRFIIVDEASMLDVDTTASLFRAISPSTQVLFIGDPYQLPPVGHGAPLRDLIAAKLPYGELTEIHRNDGGIVAACRDIKQGQGYRPSSKVNVDQGENLQHIETATDTLALSALKRMLTTCPNDVNPVWDCQVICSLNEKGNMSRKPLNAFLQNLLNPHGQQFKGNSFRLNDKVICTSNAWFTRLPDDLLCEECGNENLNPRCSCGAEVEDVKETVANGEIGKVIRITDKSIVVAFDAPRRCVRVPIGGSKDDGTGGASSFDLGYAITGHKSQGSQWPFVFVVSNDSRGADMVCPREWWYTALSRVETLGFTIGKLSTINRQCRRISLKDRKTFLTELITEELNNDPGVN